MSALGRHILVEFIDCDSKIINDAFKIEQSMVSAAKESGATVINSTFHHFSPFGVSGVVVIQESHLAIHTWPEYQYAAVDLFTCGDSVDPWISFDSLKKSFNAKNYSALELKRGNVNLLTRVEVELQNQSRFELEKFRNKGKITRNIWFTDKDENQALSLRYKGETLYDKTSEYQRTRIIDTYAYGKTLTIDNMVMCTEKDEAHYHEMIVHPALITHPNPKNILLIGGGDGGSIREIFKHQAVEKCTMVEIDKNVIEASKIHLPELSCEFENKKLDLKIEDGIAFIKNSNSEIYDIIIVDGSDPVGPAEGLFSVDFFRNCYRSLKSNGMIVVQGESPNFNAKTYSELNKVLGDIFVKEKVYPLLFSIPTYPTGIWGFQLASKGNLNPKNIEKDLIINFEHKNELKYYNSDIHFACFAIPNYVKKMLD